MTPPENKLRRLTKRGLRTILKRINDIAARLSASRDPALHDAIDRLHDAAGEIDFVMLFVTDFDAGLKRRKAK